MSRVDHSGRSLSTPARPPAALTAPVAEFRAHRLMWPLLTNGRAAVRRAYRGLGLDWDEERFQAACAELDSMFDEAG